MYDKILKVKNSFFGRREGSFQPFDIWLHTKDDKIDWYWKQKTFKKPIKTIGLIRNILFSICAVYVWIETTNLWFEKHDYWKLLLSKIM